MNPQVEEYYNSLIERGKFKKSEYSLNEFAKWVQTDGAVDQLWQDDIKDGLYKKEDYSIDQMKTYLGLISQYPGPQPEATQTQPSGNPNEIATITLSPDDFQQQSDESEELPVLYSADPDIARLQKQRNELKNTVKDENQRFRLEEALFDQIEGLRSKKAKPGVLQEYVDEQHALTEKVSKLTLPELLGLEEVSVPEEEKPKGELTGMSAIKAGVISGAADLLSTTMKGIEALKNEIVNPYQSDALDGSITRLKKLLAAERITPEEALRYLEEADQYYRPVANSELTKEIDAFSKQMADMIKYNDQGVVETFDKDGVVAGLGKGANEFSKSVPLLVSMVLTGGTAGTVLAGTSAYGKKYDELKKQGFEDNVATFNSAVTATAEMLTERISFGILKGQGKTITGALRGDVKKAVTAQIMKGIGVDALQEGGSEALSQLIENTTDYLMGVTELKEGDSIYDHLTKGVADSFIVGGIGGTTMRGGGEAASATIRTAKKLSGTKDADVDSKSEDNVPDTGESVTETTESVPDDIEIVTESEKIEISEPKTEIDEKVEKVEDETITDTDATKIDEKFYKASDKPKTKSGKTDGVVSEIEGYNVDNVDGQLKISRKGKYVPPKKRQQIMDKYIETNIDSMKNSKDATELPEGIKENEVVDYLAENSNNASELADVYLEGVKDQPVTTKEDLIHQELSKTKFSKDQLKTHFSDQIIDKDWGRYRIGDESDIIGGDLNEIATNLNNELDRNDITDQDVADYISKYRYGDQEYIPSNQNDGLDGIRARFSEITGGVPLTEANARKVKDAFTQAETARLEAEDAPVIEKGKSRYSNFRARAINDPRFKNAFREEAGMESKKRENVTFEAANAMAEDVVSAEMANSKNKDEGYRKIVEGIKNSGANFFKGGDSARFDLGVYSVLLQKSLWHFANKKVQSKEDAKIAQDITDMIEAAASRGGTFNVFLRADANPAALLANEVAKLVQKQQNALARRNLSGQTILESIEVLVDELKKARSKITRLENQKPSPGKKGKSERKRKTISATIRGMSKADIAAKKRAAIDKFKKGSGTLTSGGLDVARMEALAEIGYYTFLEGARTFKEWSDKIKAMVGDVDKSILEDIWNKRDFDGSTLSKMSEENSMMDAVSQWLKDNGIKGKPKKEVMDAINKGEVTVDEVLNSYHKELNVPHVPMSAINKMRQLTQLINDGKSARMNAFYAKEFKLEMTKYSPLTQANIYKELQTALTLNAISGVNTQYNANAGAFANAIFHVLNDFWRSPIATIQGFRGIAKSTGFRTGWKNFWTTVKHNFSELDDLGTFLDGSTAANVTKLERLSLKGYKEGKYILPTILHAWRLPYMLKAMDQLMTHSLGEYELFRTQYLKETQDAGMLNFAKKLSKDTRNAIDKALQVEDTQWAKDQAQKEMDDLLKAGNDLYIKTKREQRAFLAERTKEIIAEKRNKDEMQEAYEMAKDIIGMSPASGMIGYFGTKVSSLFQINPNDQGFLPGVKNFGKFMLAANFGLFTRILGWTANQFINAMPVVGAANAFYTYKAGPDGVWRGYRRTRRQTNKILAMNAAATATMAFVFHSMFGIEEDEDGYYLTLKDDRPIDIVSGGFGGFKENIGPYGGKSFFIRFRDESQPDGWSKRKYGYKFWLPIAPAVNLIGAASDEAKLTENKGRFYLGGKTIEVKKNGKIKEIVQPDLGSVFLSSTMDLFSDLTFAMSVGVFNKMFKAYNRKGPEGGFSGAVTEAEKKAATTIKAIAQPNFWRDFYNAGKLYGTDTGARNNYHLMEHLGSQFVLTDHFLSGTKKDLFGNTLYNATPLRFMNNLGFAQFLDKNYQNFQKPEWKLVQKYPNLSLPSMYWKDGQEGANAVSKEFGSLVRSNLTSLKKLGEEALEKRLSAYMRQAKNKYLASKKKK